jgi:hypothetical protein
MLSIGIISFPNLSHFTPPNVRSFVIEFLYVPIALDFFYSIAIFFNHEQPEDLGISGAFGAYSNEVLASIFGLQPKILDDLPKYQEDLFVVGGA